jgi:putative restriction endonuclease
MRYWWVNQNQTYRTEIRGNFMWSPKVNANGARNPFYDFMREADVGDLVFSYYDTLIQALGMVTAPAQTAPKPNFGTAGANWANEGWFVPVYYCALENPIRPADHIALIRPLLPARLSPLRPNGHGNQGVYLTAVPQPLAELLIGLMGESFPRAFAAVVEYPTVIDAEVEEMPGYEPEILPTYREQIVKARRGQGVFRSNVLLTEKSCRVTGVSDPKHLRASHIKPWRAATDTERLSGFNGLLLSPHIDHLFDKGHISFSIDRRLLVADEVERDLLDKWGIERSTNVGEFNHDQQAFLEHHRVNIFGKG